MGNQTSIPQVQEMTGETYTNYRVQEQNRFMFLQTIWYHLSGAQTIVGINCSESMEKSCDVYGDTRTRSQYVHDIIEPHLQKIISVNTDGSRAQRAVNSVDMVFYGSTLDHHKMNWNNYRDVAKLLDCNMGCWADTATVIKKMYKMHQKSSSHNTRGIVITDGSLDNVGDCLAALDSISKSIRSQDEFNILILRVGHENDSFFEQLDTLYDRYRGLVKVDPFHMI